MKVIFSSFVYTLPMILRLFCVMVLIFIFFPLVLTKAFKGDGYYCDNAYQEVTTKQDCWNWGGDWVQYQINMSSPLHSLYFGILLTTMEGWMYLMSDFMNMNGRDQAPLYNANEHIQIYLLLVFFVGGILLLNIYISFSIVSFQRTRERLSGEANLSEAQKQWLHIKAFILQM